MVINGENRDKLSINMGNFIVGHCLKYEYLGSIFTSDGNVATALKEHLTEKMKELYKLVLFYYKNTDMPFIVKKKVLDVAFTESILYGCESWLNVNLKGIEKMYIKAVKSLLGVRASTANNLCLIELDYAPLQLLVMGKQTNKFEKMISARRWMMIR